MINSVKPRRATKCYVFLGKINEDGLGVSGRYKMDAMSPLSRVGIKQLPYRGKFMSLIPTT